VIVCPTSTQSGCITYISNIEIFKNVENDCYSQKQAEKDDFLVKMFPSLPMNCQTSLSDSSKALYYRIFKTKFEFEEYFNIWNIGDIFIVCVV
jgi:hypothetical protein